MRVPVLDDLRSDRSEASLTHPIVVEVDEVDGQRLRVVRPRALPARSPLIARRFDERAQLGVEGVLDYVRSNVSAQPPWFATALPEGVELDRWLAAAGTQPTWFEPGLALRIVFDLATLGREIYKASATLPATPLTDVVVDRNGRTLVGYLGEFSTRPRAEESLQMAHLARLTRQLAGPTVPPAMDDAVRRWESGQRLGEICDAIELLWLAHPELRADHGRIAEIVRRIEETTPQIAAPTWASVSDQGGPDPAVSQDGMSTLKVSSKPPSAPPSKASSKAPSRPPSADTATPSTLGIGREPHSGATVGGKYRLIRSLGGGAMGQVYEATHLTRGQVCAVKVLRTQGANARAMSEFAERFRREARAMSALDHPNVVAVHDFGSDDVCWLAMDLVSGPSLSTLLAEGPLPVRDAIEVAQQLSLALAYAHARGIVHRDIKPANVLVCERNPIRVKLADFGLAKSWHDAEYTIEGTLVGTPQYMSPEQCQGQPATPHSDIYALGLVLYRMLTGRTPFEDHKGAAVLLAHTTVAPLPMSSYRVGIPDALERVVAKCLAKSPESRFADAGALGKALAECVVQLRTTSSSLPMPVPPPAAAARPSPAPSRSPLLGVVVVGVVLLALAAVVGGGVLAFTLRGGTEPTHPVASPAAPAPLPAPTTVAEPVPAPPVAAPVPEPPPETPPAPPPSATTDAPAPPRPARPKPAPAPRPVAPAPPPAPAPAEPEPSAIPSSGQTDLKNPFKR